MELTAMLGGIPLVLGYIKPEQFFIMVSLLMLLSVVVTGDPGIASGITRLLHVCVQLHWLCGRGCVALPGFALPFRQLLPSCPSRELPAECKRLCLVRR